MTKLVVPALVGIHLETVVEMSSKCSSRRQVVSAVTTWVIFAVIGRGC